MNPTSHRPESDLLRRQVADLARELAERDRVLNEQTRHREVAQALAHLGSWNWDIASGGVEWSDELYRIFGYESRSRAITFDSFVSAVLPDDHDRVLASIDDALAGAATYDMECRIVRPDGEVRTIHCCGEVARDSGGQPLRMSGAALDVTERKRMEAMLRTSQEKLRQALHASGTGLWEWNTDTNEVAFSEEWKYQLGYESAEIVDSFETWAMLLHPEDRDAAIAYAQDYVSSREGDYRQEFRLKHKDGGYRWIEARASFVTEADGRRVRLLGSHTDITDRKRMEEAVRENEERYRTLVELSPSGVFVFSEGRTVYVNHTGAVLMGANDAQEIVDRPTFEFIHPDDHHEVRENVKRLLSGGASVHSAERIYLKMDGTPFPVQVEAGRITWNGKPAILGLFSDITERKRIEMELVEREEHLRLFIEHSPVALAMLDRDMRYLAVSRRWRTDYRVGDGPLIGRSHYEVFPEIPERWKAIHRRCLAGAVEGCEEDAFVRTDGRTDWSRWEIRPWLTAEGSVGGIVIFSEDITGRKQSEQALRESEERFSIAFRTSLNPIGITELETGRCIEVNAACLKLFGFRREEVIGNTTLMLGIWPNLEDRARFIQRLKAGEPARNLELRVKTKSGDDRHILVSSDLAELNGILCLITVGNDITERKQAEEALRISEERFAKAFKASPHPVVISELDSGRVVDANDAAYQVYGYRKEEVVGQTTVQVGLWPLAEERVCFVERLKRSGSVRDMEVTLQSGDGEIRRILLSSELIELNGKQCCVTVGDDVTKSRRMERALRLTQFSVDQAVEAIVWLDPNARIFNVNDTACRMLEYSREQLLAMTVHDIDPNFPVERWGHHWNTLKQQGALIFDAKFWSRSGGVLETDVTVNYLQYEGQEYGCMILRDIGERKRAEAELHRSHAFLRQVIDTDPDLIFAKDRDGRFTVANKAVADWHGTTVEELIGKSDADFNANAEEVEFFRRSDLEVLNSGRDRFIPEERITDAGGKTRWLQTVKRPIFDDQGRVHMVLGASTDITERKRMEEILLQRERDLSAALEERERISQDLHDGILQSLYAIGLGLEACKPLIKKQPDHVAEKFMATLDHAIGQLNQIMTEVRNFIAGLESQVLQGGDFSTALRTMVETMSISSSVRCRVRIDDEAARRLSTEQALHIINIVREGVSNALRHSRAKQITVSLRDLIRSDRLAVTDDGIGFNTRSVQGVGHGLVNMAARAQKVRGLFAIQSKPDKGTRISLDLPKDTHYAHN